MSAAFERTLDPRLFPATVSLYSIALHRMDADWERVFGIELPRSLLSASQKRRRDYLAGRYCARRALSGLDRELAAAQVHVGGGGEPVWPVGVVGSITHTTAFASAVVARVSDASALGIDAEPESASSAITTLEGQVVSPGEAALLASSGLPRPIRTLLAFSAKESVFKCLYPRARQHWEFDEVEIVEFDATRRAFVARGASARSIVAWPNTGVRGSFHISDGYVYTGAWVLPPPAGD